MTPNKYYRILTLLFILLSITFIRCSNDPEPPIIYDPNTPLTPDPAITAVDPSQFALAGFTQVKITGANFAPTTDTLNGNIVYFNDKKATVISATAGELIVIPPNIEADNISIKVVTPGSFKHAEYKPYMVRSLKQQITLLEDPDDPNHNPTRGQVISSFEVGPDEALYVLTRVGSKGTLAKITQSGTVIFSPDFPSQPSIQPSDLKYGPEDKIYWLRGAGNANIIYRVVHADGIPETWATFPSFVQYFDFSQDKSIYAIGKNGIYHLDVTGTTATPVGDYAGFTPKGIKVTATHVYVLGTSPGGIAGIWRSQIQPDGTLSTAENIFNWNNAGAFSAFSFNSFVMSFSNDFYISTNNPTDPVLLVNANGTSEALYSGQLPTYADLTTGAWQLAWGSGQYIYYYRTGTNLIFKVFVGKDSSPYFGRL